LILREANEAVVLLGTPFEGFTLSFCIVLLKSLLITLEVPLITFGKSYVCQNKAKPCENVRKRLFNKFKLQRKHNLKSNYFKQFTMWNGLSHVEAHSQAKWKI